MAKPPEPAVPPMPEDTTYDEKHFHHYTAEMSFRREEVAFAMVDLWDTGFGPAPLTHLGWEAEYNAGKSFCDRAGEIEMTKILPMLEACRKAGLAVCTSPHATLPSGTSNGRHWPRRRRRTRLRRRRQRPGSPPGRPPIG